MYLSDKDLKILALKQKLIEPFKEGNCEGATINLTLHPQVKKYVSEEKHIMVNKPLDTDYESVDISNAEFYLPPNDSVLVQAYEYFRIPTNMIAVILERYSIKLLGLVVSPASYMNPGYEGRLSFLLTNHSKRPIRAATITA
jgi:dCTP deaminase